MANTTAVVKGYKLLIPDNIIREYNNSLDQLAAKLQALTIKYIIANREFTKSYNRSIRSDDITDDLESANKTIKAGVARNILSLLRSLPDIFSMVLGFTRRNIKRSISHIENISFGRVLAGESNLIRLPKISTLRKMWVAENTRLIKSISEDMRSRIGQIVSDGVNRGESAASLKSRIEQVAGITKRRAAVIARDQITKLKSALNRYESIKRGVLFYEWSTAKDDAVRASHKVMNSKICSWLDASIYKDSMADRVWKKRSSIDGVEKHPGEDILCRCTNILVTNSMPESVTNRDKVREVA